jgi:hypothetical protein
MDLIGLMTLAGHRAFEVRNKTGTIDLQILVVLHDPVSGLRVPYLAPPRGRRGRNTTKCDSEKLTAKLTRMDASFASRTGMK